MKSKFVTQEWNIDVGGHRDIEFVDVNLLDDQKLFIDPCLIEIADDPLCQQAQITISNYFDNFFAAYRMGDLKRKEYLLSHAGEINHTRLGYGDGENGHGNTAEGLLEKFSALDRLSLQISSFGKAIDLPVFVPGFDKDGLSDMLTNIIHKELNDFTLAQCKIWGIIPNDTYKFWTWDGITAAWVEVESPCYRAENGILLLVPKRIVRHRYICNVGQYFSRVVLERLQQERAYRDEKGNYKTPSKKVVEAEIVKLSKNWKYDYAVDYATRIPDALSEYHRRIPEFYADYWMSDDDLDARVYHLS